MASPRKARLVTPVQPVDQASNQEKPPNEGRRFDLDLSGPAPEDLGAGNEKKDSGLKFVLLVFGIPIVIALILAFVVKN